jgi:protein-L-isoaspartate(D-aspartate) O-methyltransferase
MIDSERARRTMVDTQLRTADVTDTRVLDAFLDVPRERFVPPGREGLAYLDLDLPLMSGEPGRCLMQPMVLAKLIQALDVGAGDRVLVVAAGTGYSAAILSRLAGSVVALESDTVLAAIAAQASGADPSIRIATGPLEAGHQAAAPYDAILIEGAIEVLPDTLVRQLADGGRLATIMGFGRPGRATLYVKSGDDIAGRVVFDIVGPPLRAFAKPPAFAF